MNNKTIGNTFCYFGLIVVYRLLLDYCFGTVISTIYAYNGFFNLRTAISTIISWIVVLFFSMLTKRFYDNKDNKASYEVLYILFLISFIPFTSMLCFGNTHAIFNNLNIVFWFELVLLVRVRLKENRLSTIKPQTSGIMGEHQIKIITILSAIVVIFISAKYTHFRLSFSLADVYTLRAEASEYSLPVILTYLFSWTRNLNSILLAYYMRRKKIGWSIMCIAVQLLNFGIDGSKTTLFLLLFVIAINLFPKVELSKMNRFVLFGFCLLLLICVFAHISFNNIWPISLFVRRVLFVPIKISVAFVDFFTKHTPDYFRQGFLRRLGLTSPYPPIPYMIAEKYWNEVSSANNGLISDAITNLGIAGIFVFPVLLSFVLRWLDRSARGLDLRIYLSVALYLSIVLTNSFLFTVLLTHGLLITIIVLSLMKREKEVVGRLNTFVQKSSLDLQHDDVSI